MPTPEDPPLTLADAQGQCVHELHALVYRGVIEQLLIYVEDLTRRLASDPVTRVWVDGVLQPQPCPS